MTSIADLVEDALPDGDVVQLPEEWRMELADKEVRKESPSSITSFLICPLKWYMERYSPLPESDDDVSLPGVVGTFVHRVLEVFYSEPAHLRTRELLDRTFNIAWDALKQGNDEDGIVEPNLIHEFQVLERLAFKPESMRAQFRDKARKAVDAVEDFDGDPAKLQVLANETWVRHQVGNVLLRGKIDRIDRGTGGREIVVDYKGLALDTPIPTPSGWTTMGALEVGDQVLGKAGTPVNVTVKSDIHNRPCYRITFLDGSSIVCDNVHLWEVTESRRTKLHPVTSVMSADDLYTTFLRLQDEGRTRSLYIGNPDALDLPESDLEIDPWLLGAWLGDGSSRSGDITVGKDDWADMLPLLKESWRGSVEWWEYDTAPTFVTLNREHADRCYFDHVTGLNQYGYASAGLCTTCHQEGRTKDDLPVNPSLRTLLQRAGVLNNKHVPTSYLRGSRSQRLALLQGLMDTDGSWNAQRSRAVFVSTRRELAAAVEELVASLGGTTTTFKQTYVNEVRGQATAYSVTFNPVGYNPFRLPRKALQVDDHLRSGRSVARATRRIIRSVEVVDSVPTQCIKVDAPDSLYLAGPLLTPTHNTGRPYGADGTPDVLDPTFVPVGMYAWMRTQTTKNDLVPVEVAGVRLLYLSHLKRVNVKSTPETLAKTDLLVKRVVEEMDNIVVTGDIKVTPAGSVDDAPCRWCPAQALCPAFNDGSFQPLRDEYGV